MRTTFFSGPNVFLKHISYWRLSSTMTISLDRKQNKMNLAVACRHEFTKLKNSSTWRIHTLLSSLARLPPTNMVFDWLASCMMNASAYCVSVLDTMKLSSASWPHVNFSSANRTDFYSGSPPFRASLFYEHKKTTGGHGITLCTSPHFRHQNSVEHYHILITLVLKRFD